MTEARVVSVDMDRLRTDTPRRARWFRVEPGTDVDALRALGVGRVELAYLVKRGVVVLSGDLEAAWPPGSARVGRAGRRPPYEPAPALIADWNTRDPRHRERRARRCLGCGRPFRSEGPGNRLCGVCLPRVNGVSPFEPM